MLPDKSTLSILLSGALLACANTAFAQTKAVDGMLVGDNGMTLYTFDKDVIDSGKSVCNGPCATNWPPLMAADGATAKAPYTIITRDDGKKQYAMAGKPLYFWAKDTKAGDKTGDGAGGNWHIVKQ